MKQVSIKVDQKTVNLPKKTTVAGALLQNNIHQFRKSVSGQPRGPLCGMGICHECRVTIDGIKHQRSCMIMCTPGMEIQCG